MEVNMWWCFHCSTKMCIFLCLLVLSALSVHSEGNVGCLFISELCEDQEQCFDDNAFGKCQSAYDPDADSYRHVMSSSTIRLLEGELLRLFTGGYRWVHEYAQCVVQNILYANRHGISYDPGLCARLMQLSLPPVPPDLFQDLKDVDPEEMAFIKFKPDRDNPDEDIYADEIFSPPILEEETREENNRKRSPSDSRPFVSAKERKVGEKDTYGKLIFNQLMEAAKDTEELFREYGERGDKYPDDELPVITTDLSSDLDSRPIFSEGGLEWLPAPDSEDAPLKKRKATGKSTVDEELRHIGREGPMFLTGSHGSSTVGPGDVGRPRKKMSPIIVEKEPVFRWNYRPRKDMMAEDLNQWAYTKDEDQDEDEGVDRNDGRMQEEEEDNNSMEDVVEDDYMENQLYAILPIDNGMPTFQRNMRYDIKKPGPNYAYHENDDDDLNSDSQAMAEPGATLLTSLMERARIHQLHGVLGQPVENQKSSSRYSPREEIIEEERRFKEYVLPPFFPTNIHPPQSNKDQPKPIEKSPDSDEDSNDDADEKRTFEGIVSNQPELIEGLGDSGSKPMRDEDRIANVAKTGEGHIGHFDSVDATHAYLTLKEKSTTYKKAEKFVKTLEKQLQLQKGVLSDVRLEGNQISFKVNQNSLGLNASDVAAKAEALAPELKAKSGLTIDSAGIGDKVKYEVVTKEKDRKLFILTFALCGGVAGILLAVAAAFMVRRHARSREKLQNITQPDTEASLDYQDLCRQRMCSKASEKQESTHSPKKIRSLSQGEGHVSSSSHSSTSSWNEEPAASNMDISTGHMILSYMEDHLKNKDRLDREWEALCAYEAELCSTAVSVLSQNIKKNRYTGVLPYDHSRVTLNELSNVSGSDYINASSITDHDPRNPAYIATQGPLPHTAADFWQMIWEQGSVVIVMLSRLMENGVAMCHRYWPEEGSEVYHIYEVHLVSEHIWCDDYLVRSFYLKNLRTTETRTVTQFHFLSWPDNGVPNSTKALLEFRRKVNKSYRGRSCPIVVLCSDGIGRTGTYCLIDMVLNRMAKGAKEIDIAATLEHVRDQRGGMVKTKAQFEFVLMAIAEEVHAILKSLSQ